MNKIAFYIKLILLLLINQVSFNLFSQSIQQIDWKIISQQPNHFFGMITKDNSGNFYELSVIDNGTSITINGTTVSGGNLSVGAIIKYDSNQNPVWIKEIPFVIQSFGNIAPHKFLFHNGSIYLFVAYRQNGISMDGINFPPYQSNIGTGDLALIKINASTQNTEWIKFIARPGCFSTIPPDNFEIYFDKNDNIHAVGTFSNKLIFENSNDTIGNPSDTVGVNAFHLIYDTLGHLLSAQDLGIYNQTPNSSAYEYFSMDNQNNIYRFIRNTKEFIKYDAQGNILFYKQFQGNGTITGMKVDPWHNVVLSGYFSSSTMTFGGFSTSKTGGNTDAVLIKFNGNNGNVEWIRNPQDPDCDRFDFINMDAMGNIYVLNQQYGWCQSPGASMLAKYNSDGNLLYKNTINGGNLFPNAFPNNGVYSTRAWNISLSADGGTILVSGKLTSGQNIMKGFIIKYGICNIPKPTVNIVNSDICEGESATLSVGSLPNYKYLWSNGDTTATIQVNESGRYSVVAIEDSVCYSKSKDFYINVHPLPDTTVSKQNNILTATDTTQGLSYQWIDCQNGSLPISGATNPTFEPAENGEYAVIITTPNGCSDTSSCHVINTLSIKNNPILDKQITIYPNPTNGEVNIKTELKMKKVNILDLQGEKILSSNDKNINISSLSSGVYLIVVTLENNQLWQNKIIKN